MYATAAEAKKAGWYSRRHRTREESRAAKDANDLRKSTEVKKRTRWNEETETWDEIHA